MIINLSDLQEQFIGAGAKKRARMRKLIERALKRKQHLYIYSEPGLGKTYTVEQVLELLNIEWAAIEGNTSLFGFGVDIAVIDHFRDKKKHMFVFIDDCDTLLFQTDSVNTLKIMLNKRRFTYGKSLSAQYNQLDDDQKDIIDQYRRQGKSGFEVDLDNITFIWCSNYKLSDQVDLTTLSAKKTGKSENAIQKAKDEIALRRRMDAKDFDLSSDVKLNETWGWIADCVLNETPPNMEDATEEDKMDILNWMYHNWPRLKEHNISFAEKLWRDKDEDPDGYKTTWELDHLV